MRDKIEYKGIVITDKEDIEWIEREVNEDLSGLSEDNLKLLKKTYNKDDLLDLILSTTYNSVDKTFGSESTITFHVWMAMYSVHSSLMCVPIGIFQQIARKGHTDIRVVSDSLDKNFKPFRVEIGIELNGMFYIKQPSGKDKEILTYWYETYQELNNHFINYVHTYREKMLERKRKC